MRKVPKERKNIASKSDSKTTAVKDSVCTIKAGNIQYHLSPRTLKRRELVDE